MSLINDALRRASKVDKERSYQPPTPPPMEPAEPAPKKSRAPIFVALGVVAALVFAGFFFRMWWSSRSNSNAEISTAMNKVAPMPAAQPLTPAAPAQPKPAPAVPIPVVSEPAPAPAPSVAVAEPAVAPAPAPGAIAIPTAPIPAPAAQPIPLATQAPAAQPAVNESAVVWPTNLKLSAIFYGLNHPRVIINGGVYGLGDMIENVTVSKIEKNKVTVDWNGHKKELTMDGQ